ncbi:dihydroorotate dehydrogenase [Anaerovibrio sp.]|uniref:dihydroorotate dehydrogenase n=2 Tax=Anaerovibrio sp. TaxID=1872532 RepID=UPI0026333E21|nr:dihydroorotate dehydrogenase [Anaerovibrio sp.]MCI6484633.1 dihydroorotate dehydrogenase [Selenomonadaceae bacterium]MDD6598326.1 dihydroorotate dehydrogenase [Anaerovibrio sp.]
MNFERLATDFAGIKLKTPVMGASGTFGFGIEYKDFLDLGDVGAIISKGLTPLPRPGNTGVRVAETPGGMLNCIGLENPGIDVFLRDILPRVQQEASETAFIANFSAGTVEEYGMMAAKLDVDGVDGVEVNISCPNVKEGGIVFGTDPRAAAAVTEAVKKNTKKPVIVKLSPNVTDIALMARAVEEAGADAIALINTLTGMVIDTRTWQPLLGNITGGLSGPAVKPIAVRMVWQAAQAVKIPILGLGGITCGEDAVEFLLAGASAVAVGAENFVHPDAVVRVAEDIDAYLAARGLEHVSQLVGQVKL